MAFPSLIGVDDYNSRNPCCCPLPECVFPTLDFEVRAADACRPGFYALSKDTPVIGPPVWPDAFDYWSFGVLVPVYKTKQVLSHVVTTGRRTIRYKLYSGDPLVVEDSFSYIESLNYNLRQTVNSEYGQPIEYWPASTNRGLPSACPPESDILPASAPTGLSMTSVDAEEGFVTVKLSWADNRPVMPGDPETKAGQYQIKVNGSIATGIFFSDTEFHITLSETDMAWYYFQVRHDLGEGIGQWSNRHYYSLSSEPRCPDLTNRCDNSFSEGNVQQNQKYSDLIARHTWTTGTDSGNYGCDYSEPTVPSPEIILAPVSQPATGDLTFTYTRLENEDKLLITGSTSGMPDPDHPELDDEPGDYPDESTSPPPEVDPTEPVSGWNLTTNSNVCTTTDVESTTYSDNRNAGDTTLSAMLVDATTTLSGFDDLFGWGLYSNYYALARPVNGPAMPYAAVRCFGNYPITSGGGAVGELFVTLGQARYRWYIGSSHTGTLYKTTWNIARFDDRWCEWAEKYYDWAVEKYAFLNRPEPGDEDYPVLEDFEGPDAAEQLADAIAALPQDPGTAPVEPESLRPSIISSPPAWNWSVAQAASEPESLDICDPTYDDRTLVAPVEADFETPELYAAALAAYNAAVAAATAKSKRVSSWSIITPDRVSDLLAKPTPVAPLPPEPTAYDIALHARRTATYNYLLARYEDTTRVHESFRIANVRHVCGATPAGAIENWDSSFPVTELPALDPASFNPNRYAEWYQLT